MECEIIDLQEYKNLIEKKETEEVEALAEKVREAIKELGPLESVPFMVHDWQSGDIDLLSNSSFYDYHSFLSGYTDSCPHCGSSPTNTKSE